MKKILAAGAMALLALSASASAPQLNDTYRLQHANGMYLTRTSAQFTLQPYDPNNQAQCFRVQEAPNGDALNLLSDNDMYLASVRGLAAAGLSTGSYPGAQFRVAEGDGGLATIINIALPEDSCALVADADGALRIGAQADAAQWKFVRESMVPANVFQTTVVDHYYDKYLPYDDPRARAYPGYKLVFAEEFNTDGVQPSTDVWTYEIGFKRNREDQFYTDSPNNTWTEGGVLVFNGRREAPGEVANPNYNPEFEKRMAERMKNRKPGADGEHRPQRPRPDFNPAWNKPTLDWTSASIITKGSPEGDYSWMYGIYEVRAKVPAYAGMWPAIWSTGKQYRWPYGGEIDIMEWYRDMILGNLCWGDQKWNSSTVGIDVLKQHDPNWGDNYHVWKMVWDYDHMEIWCDDVLVNYADLDDTVNPIREGEPWSGVNPFRDVRQGLWLNLALGGQNGGSLADAPDDNYYLVDYARVYQKIGTDGKATYHVDPYAPDAVITQPKNNPRASK